MLTPEQHDELRYLESLLRTFDHRIQLHKAEMNGLIAVGKRMKAEAEALRKLEGEASEKGEVKP